MQDVKTCAWISLKHNSQKNDSAKGNDFHRVKLIIKLQKLG